MKTALRIFSWIGVIASALALIGLVGDIGIDPDAGPGVLVALLWGIQSVLVLVYLNKSNGDN